MSSEEFNKTFSKRLRCYLQLHNMTQLELSKRLGVGTTSVYNWYNGLKTPRMDKVDAMCEIFHCNRSDFIEDKANPKDNHSYDKKNGVVIKVLGHVASDIPINAITDIVDTEEISEDLARTGEFFALKIKGDFMEPRICDGDVVIVRQQDDADSGDIVIAMINGDDATCKRLVKYTSSIALVSLNSKYEPMVFTETEIASKPVRIIGKVVELRGKF